MFLADLIFPELRGLSWDVTKMPEFFTLSKVSPSGIDVTALLSAYPRWHFSLSYEYLHDGADGELQKLLGFFLRCRGNAVDFLYRDPSDYETARQVFGAGDGKTKDFQLCHEIGGVIAPIYDTYDECIYVGDTQKSDGYRIHEGMIAFEEPPAIGQRLSWSGRFYYRCRFKESSMEFQNFSFRLWSAKTVEFVTARKVFA